ncbi:unnamed protein product [Pieris macdunnoughi]|uniref:CHK kinase-like domain-containing protein n=1 Tax=Pieris macdunnoughi TaxID=345717 RepID=A0A821WQB6_9NEOP|nr:unnamed protein product [Pieris macdunnoughi]
MENKKKTLDDLPTNVKQCINNVIEAEGHAKHDVFVRNISTGGNNFMGELFEIDVTSADKETNIFVKKIINNEDFKVYSIQEVYEKEAFIYNELSDIYTEIQKLTKIPSHIKFKFPKSYKETNVNAIILENITKRGYKQKERFDLTSLDFGERSLKELAKFHALSFVLEKQRPGYFETKIKTIKQSFVYDEYWNVLVKKMCDVSIAELKESDKERVRQFITLSLVKYPQYMTGGNCSIKCLCHGDYKMNNVMIKEENGKLIDVLPIDYQQIYYGNPIIDLIYFIYASSDRPFRKQHLHHLKEFYYSAFSEFLSNFDMTVQNVYPKETFDKCFNECLDYALMFSLYFYPFFYISEEDTRDGNDDLMVVSIRVDKIMRDRIQGIVDDFVELGII